MASHEPLNLFGIRLVGATPENGWKLLITVGLVAAVLVLTWALRRLLSAMSRGTGLARFRFWGRQIVSIVAAVFLILGVASIWFDDPTRLTTALGLVTAGVAFALQRVITATAGYFVILRGKTFNVGDRIVMGGVRGDVISLSFMQTNIMEMGQKAASEDETEGTWIHSRQFTGRIVTVSNDKIFDEPVYNYTYHFPYLWEEMRLPVAYRDDRHKAEQILLDAARKHALRKDALTEAQMDEMERRYQIDLGEIEPHVYWRLTDNWLELTVRFLAPAHGTRVIKDAMSRDVLAALDEAGIGIASATFEITGVPPIHLTSAGTQSR